MHRLSPASSRSYFNSLTVSNRKRHPPSGKSSIHSNVISNWKGFPNGLGLSRTATFNTCTLAIVGLLTGKRIILREPSSQWRFSLAVSPGILTHFGWFVYSATPTCPGERAGGGSRISPSSSSPCLFLTDETLHCARYCHLWNIF